MAEDQRLIKQENIDHLKAIAREREDRWAWYFMGLPVAALLVVLQQDLPAEDHALVIVAHVMGVVLLLVSALAGVVAQWCAKRLPRVASVFQQGEYTLSHGSIRGAVSERAEDECLVAGRLLSRLRWLEKPARIVNLGALVLALMLLSADHLLGSLSDEGRADASGEALGLTADYAHSDEYITGSDCD